MLKDNLVEFSRSKDVLYAIDAKGGNGRLLSITNNVTQLSQVPSATTFEEQQGYLKNCGCVVENGEWVAQGLNTGKVCTPVDLRGRSTSFTIICKGVLRGESGVSYGMLYCQGSSQTAYCPMTLLWYNHMYNSIGFGSAMLGSDNATTRCDSTISNASQYLNAEHLFVQVVDFQNRLITLFVDGDLVGSKTIPNTAVSIAQNSTSTAVMNENEYLNLFIGNEANGSFIGSTNTSSISYFAFVDYAMSAEEIKALGKGGGGSLEIIEEDTSPWQSFTMSGAYLGTVTFTLVDGVYTNGTMNFIPTATGWSLDGYAAGLTTTNDVEYPYLATNWTEMGSSVQIIFTKIS